MLMAPTIETPMADEIDYKIIGDDLQAVIVTLDPGETVVAEAGAMMYMQEGIVMNTTLDPNQQGGGLFGKLMQGTKRALSGDSFFVTTFTNTANKRQDAAFSSPFPGKIKPIDLKEWKGRIIAQKDSFLCAARGVSIGIAFQRRLGVGLFGGEGFIMQRLEGDGLCFVHAGGMLHSFDLIAGQTLRVDTGCIVALQPSVNYDIQLVGGIKTALFGGEGLFFATLTGPGRVWLQSLPLSRLAGRIYKAIPSIGGSRREEGSILGGIGDLLDGDS